jgi:predicted transcriptional regulator
MVRRTSSPPPVLAIRLPPKQRAALERLAKQDDRPVSVLARKIIAEWLARQEESQVTR